MQPRLPDQVQLRADAQGAGKSAPGGLPCGRALQVRLGVPCAQAWLLSAGSPVMTLVVQARLKQAWLWLGPLLCLYAKWSQLHCRCHEWIATANRTKLTYALQRHDSGYLAPAPTGAEKHDAGSGHGLMALPPPQCPALTAAL